LVLLKSALEELAKYNLDLMGYSCTSGASGTGVADFSYYLTFLDGKRNDGCH